MKKASMYASALTLNLTYLIGQTDLVLAQITESDKDFIPGENETSQLITSSFEVRRAVIALIVIAAVALVGLWYYWRRTGQWARTRFIDEHGEDLLSKKETTFRKLLKVIDRAKSKLTSLGSGSRSRGAAGSADL
ncbi:MAG TPA: hypothetical protein DCY30_09290 [Acidimicrobiaceae bacterium]|mgnify:FL=1|jgi:hypothetical protein|nr:hypothetical protein [Acidimicrobiaceae bacterium]|tara:strand:- start:555 stop:959 length:405 start_codon:yes stop_codon:yes gene_type:complete